MSAHRSRSATLLAASLAILSSCSPPAEPPAAVRPVSVPSDAQHQGLTEPHGDHRPFHGGMVLMSGDLHYEVVFDRSGRHRIWFTDAVRMELPASIASDVRMTINRPNAPPEQLTLTIDEAGESWVAAGRPVEGENVMVTVQYSVGGERHEIELPFFIPASDG